MAVHRVVTTGVFYKGVTTALRSPQRSNALTYTPGTVVSVTDCNADPTQACAAGINFHRTIADALRWGPVVVALSVPASVQIIDTGDKLRAARVRVIEVVDLIDANLNDANLIGANLTGANLNDANLTRAYLIGANLIGANLTGANLNDANLTRAYLIGANLNDANLIGANLNDAYGVPLSGLPNGWKLDKRGLWVRS